MVLERERGKGLLELILGLPGLVGSLVVALPFDFVEEHALGL
jgi:hypothetical protein